MFQYEYFNWYYKNKKKNIYENIRNVKKLFYLIAVLFLVKMARYYIKLEKRKNKNTL